MFRYMDPLGECFGCVRLGFRVEGLRLRCQVSGVSTQDCKPGRVLTTPVVIWEFPKIRVPYSGLLF